jgi:hypothetical protein
MFDMLYCNKCGLRCSLCECIIQARQSYARRLQPTHHITHVAQCMLIKVPLLYYIQHYRACDVYQVVCGRLKLVIVDRYLEGHTDEKFSCAFNYEGYAIITGSKDNTCRIWKCCCDYLNIMKQQLGFMPRTALAKASSNISSSSAMICMCNLSLLEYAAVVLVLYTHLM